MKTKLLTACLSMALATTALANTRPVHQLFPVKQPDGTTVMLYKGGDRFFSYYTTPENQVVVRNADGTLCYAQLADGQLTATQIVVHDASLRTAEENAFVAANTLTGSDVALARLAGEQTKQNAPMRAGGASTSDGLGKYGTSASGAVPTIGEVTIPVIMVQFTDTKFQESMTVDKLTRFFNEEGYSEDNGYERGSVKDYFVDQSRGMFTPTFDVVALVTLDKGYAYYGQNGSYGSGNDANAYQMVKDAVAAAVKQGVDFSKYVSSSTQKVPNVTIYYAGPGEATGGDENTIWPHELDLPNYMAKMSETTFGSYFVGNEIYGAASSTTLMGMGVFCHEFSHAMGLPDFYDPTYSYEGDSPFGDWSVMDTGAYVNNTYAPVGYNAYERSFMGWLDIHELTAEESVTLTDPNLTAGQMAAMFRNPQNTNEYFLLENRQPGKWYSSDNGSGLLVSRFAFTSSAWTRNTVNTTQASKRACVVTASGRNITSRSVQSSDLYGNGVNNKKTHTLYAGTSLTGYELYKIIKQPDGSIKFNFRNKSLAMEPTTNEETFTKVTDASTLAVNDTVIIVCEDEAMALAIDQQGSHRAAINIKMEDGKAYGNDNVLKFTLLKTTTGNYGFYSPDKKSYLSASSTGLKMATKADNNCIADITITDGNAAICFMGTASKKNVGYEADDVQFTAYATAQGNIQIYRKGDGSNGTNGIALADADKQNTQTAQGVYNLNGQRVGESLDGLSKGIYIHGGKKVVVK